MTVGSSCRSVSVSNIGTDNWESSREFLRSPALVPDGLVETEHEPPGVFVARTKRSKSD